MLNVQHIRLPVGELQYSVLCTRMQAILPSQKKPTYLYNQSLRLGDSWLQLLNV